MDGRLAAYIASLPLQAGEDERDPLLDAALPGSSFWRQLLSAGLVWRSGALLFTHAAATALLLGSWAMAGSGALSGRLEYGWLAAWALALIGTLPLRVASRWLEGVIAVGFGGLLKQRLLAGAMAMDSELVRGKGTGVLLGEILEAEAMESLGASGGFEAALALLELLAVPFVLAWGASANLELALLAGWAALAVVLIVGNTRRRANWTGARLGLTHRLVENMIAHRTRLAQQQPSEWHRDEDRDVESYADLSHALDRSTARIEAGLSRGYVIAAFAALSPAFFAGTATLAQLAISLGGVLFAASALERLAFGVSRAAAACIAWRCVKPMFDAAAGAQAPPVTAPVVSTTSKVLHAQDVVFTHRGRIEPILKGCTLAVERGDLLLLEGETGSGKSTFASLLAGSRRPSAGFILAGGLDRHTLGDAGWRGRIAAAPQYYENHILSAPLGFNLLLSRPYPHSARDLEEASELCQEIGLGPLLERMPAGLDQIVGETGWQLSQGERSRVFLARALLQNAEVVLLDESLAALDPENLRQCLECAIRRAKTLIVIAHP